MNTTKLKERALTSDSVLRTYAMCLRLGSRVLATAGAREASLRAWLRAMRAVSGVSERTRDVEALLHKLEGFTHRSGRLLSIAENRLLAAFADSEMAKSARATFANYDLSDRVRLRFPTPAEEVEDPERLGDLMIIKSPRPESGEKGVLQIAYTESIDRFQALFDVAALAPHYKLVLEPSWWGYQDATFLRLLGHDLDVWVESPSEPDERFLLALNSNLKPIELGFGDWVDPDLFRPAESDTRQFDLVMVSSWNPVKRHDELFSTLARLRRDGFGALRVALVGYPAGWTRSHIETLVRRHDVSEMCQIFEGVPPRRVAEVVADSRAFVLLSRREGGNRAIYEALFCDTPIVVYHRHRGVNLRHINDQTGVTFEDGGLAGAIRVVLENWSSFRPREWATEHTGWPNSSNHLNERMRDAAIGAGEPWTEDLAPRCNLPNLRYASADDRTRFARDYEALASFLRLD